MESGCGAIKGNGVRVRTCVWVCICVCVYAGVCMCVLEMIKKGEPPQTQAARSTPMNGKL